MTPRHLAIASTVTPQPAGRSEIGSVMHPDPFTIDLGESVSAGVDALEPAQFGTETETAAETTGSIGATMESPRDNIARKRIFRLDEVQKPLSFFRTAEAWYGEIVQIVGTSFVARLRPLSAPESEEVTTFEIDEVESGDSRFVKLGAIFRWHVGEFTTEKGQLIKGSILVFRRLPAWSKRREEAADQEAEEAAELLGWDYAGEKTRTA